MANITAKDVAELRKKTGCGMMECKKALVEAEGNMDEAIKVLRERGLAVAAKKADRIAADGLIDILTAGDTTAMIEVNTETDFVAKNETFKNFVRGILKVIVENKPADIDALKALRYDADFDTVEAKLKDMIYTIGENMNIRRFAQVTEENGFVASYTHMGGKIGVLVDVETDVVNDAVKEMAKNVAMQIAALKPQYTSDSEVSAEYIEHEKEILMAQIANDPKMAGKPEKVIEGAVVGRLNKELKEVCLLEQPYVKAEDGKQTVAQYLAQVAKENGAKLSVKRFVRFETGEGLEKKVDDFAAEVAAQAGM